MVDPAGLEATAQAMAGVTRRAAAVAIRVMVMDQGQCALGPMVPLSESSDLQGTHNQHLQVGTYPFLVQQVLVAWERKWGKH